MSDESSSSLPAQEFHHGRRHARVHLQANGVAKTALPDGLFDGFQQVVRLQFLDGDFGVAGEMKDVRPQDLEAWKQVVQIGDDQLLEPDKRIFARRVIRARRQSHRKELRQRIGNLHASEVFGAAVVPDCYRDIQAEVRDVRERDGRGRMPGG